MEFKNINISRTNILDIDCITRQLKDHKHTISDLIDFPVPSGNNGKILVVVNNVPTWAFNPGLPSFTGNAGKYLTTDGSTPSWQFIPVQEQADWGEASVNASSFIKNKPYIPQSTSDLVNNSGYITNTLTITINGDTYSLSEDRVWSVGTVTSVAALVLGTDGTDLNSSVSNADTTPIITLNVPTASASNRGALSASDWTIFNTKVSDVTASLPIISSGGTLPNITIQQASGSQDGYLSTSDWTTFNNKQPAGDYITSLIGEATATGPGNAAITLNNASVLSKILTGVNITGGSINDSDSILIAFGKVQNQINSLVGGSIYQGTWNASTNTPTLSSSSGTKGYYYIVNVSGATSLNGITDWQIGDWAIFDGSTWQKVDNTDAVVSVNGQTGAVSLITDNIPEGISNLYYTNTRSRAALSFAAGSGGYNSTTGVITIPTNTNQLTNGAGFLTGNQTITLSGDISGSGTTSITTAIGALKVTNGMLAGSIDYAKMNAATVPTWNQNTSGNAATSTLAANSTLWNGLPRTFTTESTSPIGLISYESGYASYMGSVNLKSWLGLGSYAYRSSGLAELSGATFTGALSGTSATFSTLAASGSNRIVVVDANGLMSSSATPAVNDFFLNTGGTTSYPIRFSSKQYPGSNGNNIFIGGGGQNIIGSGTNASANTAIGVLALGNVTSGHSNVAIGTQALYGVTSGAGNTGFGNGALFGITSGQGNVGIGTSTFVALTTGSGNIGIGENTALQMTSGDFNILIGKGVVASRASMTQCLVVGYGSNVFATGATNEIVVGHTTMGNGSNTATWGNTFITNHYFSGNIRGGAFIKSGGTSAQFLKADGSSDGNTYLIGNQTITLTGDVTGSGTTAITTAIGTGKVTNAMLAGSIDYAKMNGATVPTWNQNTTGSAAYFAGYQGNYNQTQTAANTGGLLAFDSSVGYFRQLQLGDLKSWIGLGSNAYTSTAHLPTSGGTVNGNVNLSSIGGSTGSTIGNAHGSYIHIGGWGIGRTDATAVLVNTAYRADYADNLFDMNISRFTNNSGYVTSSGSVNYATSSGYSAYSLMDYYMSGRDFVNGTLVQTDINYAVSSGDTFVIEIKGNPYTGGPSIDIQIHGYIYADTIINHGGYSNGYYMSGIRAINYGGNLCFWWPRQGYWQGYTVKVYSAYAGRMSNRVTSITDTSQPTSAKQVDFSLVQSLHSGNYNSYVPTLAGAGATGTWNITSNQVTINYNNDSNSTYQMLWGSGNSVYGTSGVYVNPSNDNLWATSFNGNWNGYSYSTSGGANTMVQRDANGYIVNSYFYTSSGGAERNNSGMGYFAGFSTSDYYIRSYTAAAVGALLGNYGNFSVSGHTHDYATHRGEGTNYVDYARYVYNNGAYSGSGWVEPSDLGVRYASSAGNADTVDGQHFNWTNSSNSPTYLWAADSNGSGYLASRADLSVNYANSAGSVAWSNVSGRPTALSGFSNDLGNYGGWITSSGRAYPRRSDGGDLNFYWSGQAGQPTWLWGGNDGTNMYVYNPSNFSVSYASSAGTAGNITAYTINQNLGTSNNVTFNTVTATAGGFNSDLTLKNVLGYGSLLDASDNVNVIRFTWKDVSKGNTLRYGYAAQHIQNIIPEAVYTTNDDTLAVDYVQVHTVLIDENTRRIRILEARIQELENQLNSK